MRHKPLAPAQNVARVFWVVTAVSIVLGISFSLFGFIYPSVGRDISSKAKKSGDYRLCYVLPESAGRLDCILDSIGAEGFINGKNAYKACDTFPEPTKSACFFEHSTDTAARECKLISDSQLSRECHRRLVLAQLMHHNYGPIFTDLAVCFYFLLVLFSAGMAIFRKTTKTQPPLRIGILCAGLTGVIVQNLESFNKVGFVTYHSTQIKMSACEIYECTGEPGWLFSPSGLGVFTYTLLIPLLYMTIYLAAHGLDHYFNRFSSKAK